MKYTPVELYQQGNISQKVLEHCSCLQSLPVKHVLKSLVLHGLSCVLKHNLVCPFLVLDEVQDRLYLCNVVHEISSQEISRISQFTEHTLILESDVGCCTREVLFYFMVDKNQSSQLQISSEILQLRIQSRKIPLCHYNHLYVTRQGLSEVLVQEVHHPNLTPC